MQSGLRWMSFFLAVTTILAASKCGKKAHRSRYGSLANFQTIGGKKANCKYIIRAQRGLHIKLILENYYPEPCCLQVSVIAGPKTKGASAPSIPIPSGPRATLVVDASQVEIRVKASISARPVTITHEAVLPADGNFGMNFRATGRPKRIRSLNYPKLTLPSGVNSAWNITSKRNQNIRLEINGLQTSSDQDYVEVFDGSASLGRFSGNKKKKQLPIIKIASSGNMVIVLRTQTDTSKGFKAKVVAVDLTTEPESATSGTRTGIRRCHKRTRIMSGDDVVSDKHSRMTCKGDQICGRLVLEGTDSRAPMTSETLHCIPPALCVGSAGCNEMPKPVKGIVIKSCNLSCCDSDYCNRSPDSSNVPPKTSEISPIDRVWPLSERRGLRCEQRLEITRGSGHGQGSASSGRFCLRTSVCALYVFSGVSTDPTKENEKVVGYVATCAPQSDCNEAGCSRLSQISDVNIGSCNVTCCREDGCNDPERVTVPTLPPPERYASECYDIRRTSMGGTVIMDQKSTLSCPPQSVCLRIDASASMSTLDASVSYGTCIPKLACATVSCDLLRRSLPDGMTIGDCHRAECCETDRCNDDPASTVAPPTPVSGGYATNCYNILRSATGGSVPIDRKSEVHCPPQSVCLRIDADATVSGIDVAISYGACTPKIACASMTCDLLNSLMPGGLTIANCRKQCCETDLCNGKPASPASEVTVPGPSISGGDGESTEGMKCYSTAEFMAYGFKLPGSKKKVENCRDPNSQCLKVNAVASHPTYRGVKVRIKYGTCAPRTTCAMTNCSTILFEEPRPLEGIAIEDCNVNCCDGDLCNT